MHEPAGDDTRQLSAVPADVYPLGHVLSAISIYDSTTATYPAGHDVDGAAANALIGKTNKNKININLFNFSPLCQFSKLPNIPCLKSAFVKAVLHCFAQPSEHVPYDAIVQSDTAGTVILQKQYLPLSEILTASCVFPVVGGIGPVLEHTATPDIGTPPHLPLKSVFEPEVAETVQEELAVNATHFVTAYAGGIAQIMPAMIKCFFILNLLFIANEKTTKIFQVVGG